MASAVSRSNIFFGEDVAVGETQQQLSQLQQFRDYLSKNSFFRKFNLRVHKFSFQWDLVVHLLICILSLAPFFFTGRRLYSCIPVSVWVFYNTLFIIGPHYSNLVIPRFGKFKHSFKATVEDFFSPKLLPVLSISFLCVVLSLAVTGHRLGGPPLCYHPCGQCLSMWEHSVLLDITHTDPFDSYRIGCGYANGKEMLGYYTMAQTSFLLFLVVVVAMAVCLAWRVADEEKQERNSAEEWLKRENTQAFELRNQLIKKFGSPGSSVRPEGSAAWIFFGVTAALTFTLLGWHNWYVLPPSHTATLLIILNLLTILMTTLILHLSFFGRLLALYKRNFLRVAYLTRLLSNTVEQNVDSWWNCRNFVLNDDLSLDYDMGGLAVSATFLINVLLFAIFIIQIYRDGLQAILEPPGSYCAYACMYVCCCLIKLFTLATNTYEEQHKHIAVLQGMSVSLSNQINSQQQQQNNDQGIECNVVDYSQHYDNNNSKVVYGTSLKNNFGASALTKSPYYNNNTKNSTYKDNPINWMIADDDYSDLQDGNGPLVIEEDEESSTNKCIGKKQKTGDAVAVNCNNNSCVAEESSATTVMIESITIFENASVQKQSVTTPLASCHSNTMSDDFQKQEKEHNKTTSATSSFFFSPSIFVSPFSTQNAVNNRSNHSDDVYALFVNNNQTHDLTNNNGDNFTSNVVCGSSNGINLECGDQDIETAFSAVLHDNSIDSDTTIRNKKENDNGFMQFNSSNITSSPTVVHVPVTVAPILARSISHTSSMESCRQTIAEIISQIRKYDPYPCILGIPVMPALFNTSKFYIFISFMLIGVRVMISCLRQITI